MLVFAVYSLSWRSWSREKLKRTMAPPIPKVLMVREIQFSHGYWFHLCYCSCCCCCDLLLCGFPFRSQRSLASLSLLLLFSLEIRYSFSHFAYTSSYFKTYINVSSIQNLHTCFIRSKPSGRAVYSFVWFPPKMKNENKTVTKIRNWVLILLLLSD